MEIKSISFVIGFSQQQIMISFCYEHNPMETILRKFALNQYKRTIWDVILKNKKKYHLQGIIIN